MKKLFHSILILFALIVFVKVFIIDAYYIASDSMKNSLLSGDFILGFKSAYCIKTPNSIPFTQFKLPSYHLINLSKPNRNDIVVFKLNELQTHKQFAEKDLIKRIVGLPGETIHIQNNKVFINQIEHKNFFTIFESQLPDDEKKVISYSNNNFSYNNFGPIKIPSKGDTINLTPTNINFWQPIINYESNGKFLSTEGSVINFKGKPIKNYIIKNDYYFVLGDNVNNSIDSRIFGFIPYNSIEAKVMLIYLSIEPKANDINSNFINRIRLKRFFTTF